MVCFFKNIFLQGPELKEKGKEIAEKLGKLNFKGSNGWLGKWKARYNIKRLSVCGLGDVQGSTVDPWKERLPEIVSGYKKRRYLVHGREWSVLESFAR